MPRARETPGSYIEGTGIATMYELMSSGKTIRYKDLIKGITDDDPDRIFRKLVRHGKESELWTIKIDRTGGPENETVMMVDLHPGVPEAIEDPNAFVLEKYLEDFIVSNFDTIFKGELRIYEDAQGNDGQQYATDIGPIDILAHEPTSNAFIVIELKKGRPSDQVVGQVLRYMGWVKKNLCKDGQSVKGLVICRDPDDKLS